MLFSLIYVYADGGEKKSSAECNLVIGIKYFVIMLDKLLRAYNDVWEEIVGTWELC